MEMEMGSDLRRKRGAYGVRGSVGVLDSIKSQGWL